MKKLPNFNDFMRCVIAYYRHRVKVRFHSILRYIRAHARGALSVEAEEVVALFPLAENERKIGE